MQYIIKNTTRIGYLDIHKNVFSQKSFSHKYCRRKHFY